SRDLGRLPLLTQPEAIANQESLLAGRPGAFVGAVSSGTMHGEARPLRVLRSAGEEAALAQFHAARAPGGPGRHRRSRELVLEVRAVHHGVPEDPVPEGRLRIPWIYNANAFRLFEDMVSRPQADGRKITGLVIGAGALMPLTAHFLEGGVEPARFGVRRIGTTGFRLSPHWRAVIERVWRARVFDNFSLSEFATPALECERCGFNHWLAPPILPEVLHPLTHRPVRSGLGVLVLTGLYPFVQAMPLLRYWTADLVEQGPLCPEAADRGIRWRGRLSQSLVEGSGAVLLPSGDVIDALESLPEVARHPHPCETLGLVRSCDLGAVKVELAMAGGRARVRVEVRFDPLVFVARAAALAREIRRELQRRSPALEGRLDVELVRPGTLELRWTKF
ncbi:MAG: phenylacetate--CoA ligase family protein, partial [Myxococcaceae bacterium]